MKKDTLRGIIAIAVVLAVYHLIAFLIPFVHNATFWVSYGFTLGACAVVAAAIYIAFIKNPDAKSRFYGFPIARIGFVYGIAQLIAGIVFMALAAIAPAWAAALIFAVAMGAAILGLISAEAVVEEIHAQDIVQKADTARMRALQTKVCQLAAQYDDAALKALADQLRYADPVSNIAIFQAEADLAAAIDELQDAYVDGDREVAAQLCKKVSALLSERNRLCKLHK